MVKVLIYPMTSLILSDMVERFGHQPLGSALSIRERIQTPSIESPPLQISPEEPKKGLRYAAVEVPSGVRGRMAILGPQMEEAEAAIIITDADFAFGCMGCARTNELIKYLVRNRHIPTLELRYPRDEEEGKKFVTALREFLASLGGKKS
ncbi:MAG: methanogenesis marker 5 protein [Methanomicrobiales archaeon]|nr:methanogenesis marker 5 protein [Methanomicrobiales archaeon]